MKVLSRIFAFFGFKAEDTAKQEEFGELTSAPTRPGDNKQPVSKWGELALEEYGDFPYSPQLYYMEESPRLSELAP